MPSIREALINALVGPGVSIAEALPKNADPDKELSKVRPQTFKTDTGGEDYATSPFGFEDIDTIMQIDSYVSQAHSRKLDLMWKEGYYLRGSNPDAVRYVEQRMKIMSLAMGQTFEKGLRESSDNLLKYHNNFLVFIRDERPQQLFGLKYQGLDGQKPIAGFSNGAVSTMSIKSDDYGRVSGYKQSAGSNEKKYKSTDVIHTTHDRASGELWGRPIMSTVVEDVRSFRIIEEDILNLVHKEMYPLYVYKIGDELRPPEAKDIKNATKALSDLREDGGIAMPGKDDIDVVGSGGKTTDLDAYIKHFKERVVIGVGVSPHQIGMESGANKSSAERLDAALYDRIKSYQRDVEELVNKLFFYLLLEGGFDPLGLNTSDGATDEVTFKFKEIDVEAQIARENHLGNMFVQNQITHGEMRKELGREVDPNTAELYYFQMVEQANVDKEHEYAKELASISAASKPATTAGGTPKAGSSKTGGTNTKSPNQPAKGRSASKDSPSNQHGKKSNPKTVA